METSRFTQNIRDLKGDQINSGHFFNFYSSFCLFFDVIKFGIFKKYF